MQSLDPPPGVHYCVLCECPLPIGSSEVVCGACATEWRRWSELRDKVEAGLRTDWPVRGISHAKMQRRREGPMSRGWEFEVSDINARTQWGAGEDGEENES